MPVSLKTREIKDDITVTQDVNLDTMESDNVLNSTHRGTATGNPHSDIAIEVTTVDASGYFVGDANVEATGDELHELKEPKYLERSLTEDLTAGDTIRLTDDGNFELGLGNIDAYLGPEFPYLGGANNGAHMFSGINSVTGKYAGDTVVIARRVTTTTVNLTAVKFESDGSLTEGIPSATFLCTTSGQIDTIHQILYHPTLDKWFCLHGEDINLSTQTFE